jgi:hypothetical protein
MFTYPKHQTPDPNAPVNGPSVDDLADKERDDAAKAKKGAEELAKKDAEAKAADDKKALKKSVE